jgi:hypothetical protein
MDCQFYMDRHPAFRAIPIGFLIRIPQVQNGHMALMVWMYAALQHCAMRHKWHRTEVEIALGGTVHMAGLMGIVGSIQCPMPGLEMVPLAIPCRPR